MFRKNPGIKIPFFPLPAVINPPKRRCITVAVPDDPEHVQMFYTALSLLAWWYNWERDPDHRAKDVAQVWRQVINSVDYLGTDCRPAQVGTLIEVNDMSGLFQVICDDSGDCIAQYRCDVCSPWITLATLDQATAPNQPGGGSNSPQPAPGGGKACYNVKMNANSQYNIPTVVSTGDVIEIRFAEGAVSNSHNPSWRCPDGKQFFGGNCFNFPQMFPGDPVPTAFNGSLIVLINGSAYSLNSGPFTIPGGIVSAPAVIQVNDATIAGLSGDFTFNVCVTNNSLAIWSHDIDFTATPGGYSSISNPGSDPSAWVPSTGWEYSNFVVANAFAIAPTIASTTLTKCIVTYTVIGTCDPSGAMHCVLGDSAYGTSSGFTRTDTITGSVTGTNAYLGMDGLHVSGGGAAVISHVHWEGTGVDPF